MTIENRIKKIIALEAQLDGMMSQLVQLKNSMITKHGKDESENLLKSGPDYLAFSKLELELEKQYFKLHKELQGKVSMGFSYGDLVETYKTSGVISL